MQNDQEKAQPQMPQYVHAATDTPVEGYLDQSFIDRTSPRLNQDKVRPSGEPLFRPRKVVKDGTVVCEVVTRHRVMNRDGRDYGALVQVVVPSAMSTPYSGEQEHEKVVAMMNCPGGQASEIAMFVGDAIAAMVEENLMVSEEEQNEEREKQSRDYLNQVRVEDPLAPSLNEVMQDVMAELKAGNIMGKDAVMRVMDACEEVKDMLPFMDMVLTEMGSHPDRDSAEVQQLREMTDAFKRMYATKDDGPSIKDEAADTQGVSVPVREGDVRRMASNGFIDGNV